MFYRGRRSFRATGRCSGRIVICIALLAGALSANAGLPPGYTIEPLLPPGAPHSVSSRALFDDGRLAVEVSNGSHNAVGNVQAWVREANGTWRQAVIPAGNNQINQLGAVGPEGNMYGTWRVDNNIFDQRAFVYKPDGTFVDLGRYQNSNSFMGAATADWAGGRTGSKGFLYNVAANAITHQLFPISGEDRLATPFGSNANGWIVGTSPEAPGSGTNRGTAWVPDSVGPFSTVNMGLPVGAPSGSTAQARGINENNVAVGYFGTLSSNDGFIWDQVNGIRTLMRSPSSNTSHFAYDINDDGIIVGYRSTGTTVTAMIWEDDTAAPIDLLPLVLNPAGWDQLFDAQYISTSGLIMGRGVRNGLHTQYLLTPIPEPGMLAIVAAGAGLLIRRRPNAR